MPRSWAATASQGCEQHQHLRGVAVALSAVWQKSTLSQENGCVEVRLLDSHHVAVRDTKDPNGQILTFDAVEWAAFLAGIHRGEFDMPMGKT